MMNKKRIMVLGGSDIQVPIIEKCKDLGYLTIVADFNPTAPGIGIADVPLVVSTNDKLILLQKAKELKIDGVLTTSDLPVRVVAFIASKLNLPALSEQSAFLTTNKLQLRNKLKKEGFNVPEYSVLKNTDETVLFKNYPYVIKPVDSSGSRGVKKIYSRKELKLWFPEAVKYSVSKKIIIESFLKGREYSVESITQNGETYIIAITEKHLLSNEKGYFVENTHVIPAKIAKIELKKIEKTVKHLINVLGIDHSACHTELKIEKGEITIIEIGARLGGDFIGSELVELATGVDMLQNVINLAVGKPISVYKKKSNYSAIQFLNPINYFLAKEFIRKKRNGIHSYNFKPFQNLETKNSFDRLGFIILCFQDQNSLNAALNDININKKQTNEL